MLQKLKFILTENKSLISNFLSLSMLQIVNYVLPLITFPYLVATLGVEKFGVLAYATATIMFFQILTDYGFNLSATKEVSIYRDNIDKLSEIYNSVMSIKISLLMISFIILSILLNTIERFQDDKMVYFYTFGTVAGNVLFPIWFFQGMERMKYITYLNIIAKTFFTICIFIFVTKVDDYYIVLVLNSMGFIIIGFISIYIVKKDFKIQFFFVQKDILKKYMVDGWHIFISSIFIHIYSSISIVLLGLFTNNYYVGIYSIIEKIVAIFNGMFAPITQTLYPYVVQKININKKEAMLLIRKILKYYIFISISLSIIIVIFSYELLLFISKNPSIALDYKFYLEIASLSIILSRVGEVFGTFTLIGFGFNKLFTKIMLMGSIISIIISAVMIYSFGFQGAIYAYILSILIIVCMLYIQFNKIKEIG